MLSKSRKGDNDINSAGELVEVETQHVRGRGVRPSSSISDVAILSGTVTPIESFNGTYVPYGVQNITISNITNLNNNNDSEYGSSDLILTMLGPILLIALYVCSHRVNIVSSQYHRGAMFRRQAERVWEIQRAKDERQAVPIETRKSQIREYLQKMRVVSKCAATGHCVLGPVEEEENAGNNEAEEDKNEIPTATDDEKFTKKDDLERSANQLQVSAKEIDFVSDATSIASVDEIASPLPSSTDKVATASHFCTTSGVSCQESPGTYERKPLLSSNSEDSRDDFGSTKELQEHSQSCSPTITNTITEYGGFDDDEDVCPICLDNFEVGDIVMFSRHNICSCAHVFHKDCLMNWLLEQRENECPTCRACLIVEPDTDSTTSSSSSVTMGSDENSASGLDDANGSLVDDEANGDVEEGNVNETRTFNEIYGNNKGGDSSEDLDETGDAEHEPIDQEDENDRLEIEKIDDMEGRFKYVIVKGSVERLPL
mmetsp:Transcript_15801/g.36585  ORF Transcript_15801/g.36585 Transcript_15801/m.36585 type:complete len:486 (+) Transcript_15801:114-1571(+)|eukprot:CAMPEP_0197188222 /NCGR_PEP_ID=MMETSP1423-20130617/17464_1 /TAXON_ID=476441 /ORGANISM="Pseudo-nitzschia heimii, Strain UNC1101" /LENGTH=485 /DNA_ID=CAMNT_0042640005 /DNA_START=111 /DNA_END=1568 /DNA_ORIENTATION=+